jgi:hypothetical protein
MGGPWALCARANVRRLWEEPETRREIEIREGEEESGRRRQRCEQEEWKDKRRGLGFCTSMPLFVYARRATRLVNEPLGQAATFGERGRSARCLGLVTVGAGLSGPTPLSGYARAGPVRRCAAQAWH